MLNETFSELLKEKRLRRENAVNVRDYVVTSKRRKPKEKRLQKLFVKPKKDKHRTLRNFEIPQERKSNYKKHRTSRIHRTFENDRNIPQERDVRIRKLVTTSKRNRRNPRKYKRKFVHTRENYVVTSKRS